MSETFVTTPEQQAPEQPLSYRERLRLGLGRLVEQSVSMIDLTAGIVAAHDDLRLTRNALRHLDEPYDGLIERQASADLLSMELESDIILGFRRDAQRAGFTNTDEMPDELRTQAASRSVGARMDDLTAEIAAAHPEWSAEEAGEAATMRATDISTLFGMDAAQRDEYLAAQLKYHEMQAALPEMQTALGELQAERNERLSRMGSVALRGVVSFAGRVRDVPSALSARAMVAGMAMSDRIHTISPEKRRKAFWGTVAGVAIAGITRYVAVRHGIGSGSGGDSNYVLSSSDTPLVPHQVGTPVPSQLGTSTPDHLGNFVLPNQLGSPNLHHSGGISLPEQLGLRGATPNSLGTIDPVTPHQLGAPNTAVPANLGTPLPDQLGGAPNVPSHLGGAEIASSFKTSHELFTGKGAVDKWPDIITVSPWDSHNLDGSLTGISHQMLLRSGVHDPSQSQMNALIDALRPQAQPNGYLLRGQQLDLGPAAKVLHDILKK